MIKHIVLFKFENGLSTPEKNLFLKQLKVKLDSLVDLIPELLSMEVGLNANAKEEFDLSIIVEVQNFDHLEIYANHPEHLDVAKFLRQHLVSRSCVDYKVEK